MSPINVGRSAAVTGSKRWRRVWAEPLEDRRLMSLTVSLQTPTGATSAVVTAGEVLTLDVIATVAAPDGMTTDDGLQDVEGSFLSAAVGTSAVAGNLAVTGLTSPFNGLGSVTGSAQDLNGDGNVDVGSNVTDSSAVGDYFLARSDAVETSGTVSGASMSFVIATVTYTVTGLNGGGETDIAFRPRDTSTLPSTFASHWTEDASTNGTNEKNGTFQAGSPFRVFNSAVQAATTGTVTATVFGDTNGDGLRGGAETGLAAATVYVDVAGTGTYATGDPSALTDAAGAATITGVTAGTFTVREVPPNGYAQSTPASGAGRAVTVAAGGTVDAGTFGVEPDGSVAGSVYVDANGNGTDDAGESASGGTVVYLDVNGDGSDDAGDVSTTTAEDGTFTLADVPPGTYALRAVVGSGLAVSQPFGGSYSVRVTPGGALTGQVFGIATAGSISGTVYTDINQDGVDDAEDTVAPVGTEVYLDVAHGGAQVPGDPTAATDSTGAFHFADVAPGTYILYPVVPAGYVLTQPTAGAYTVTVTAGGTASGYAIGIVPYGTVTGIVYDDVNGNGIQDAGEPGLAGVTVYVDENYNGLDSLDITATTDATGTYTITGVPGGTHTLRDVVPAGDTQTVPASGAYTITAVNAQTTAGGAFGIDVPVVTSGEITGTAAAGATLYLDTTGNGKLDPGEPAATAADDGTYAFADLTPGTYTVRQVVRLGETLTTPVSGSYALTVTAGATDAGNDFVVAPLPGSPLTAAVTSRPAAAVIAGAAGTLKVRVTNGGTAAFAGAVAVDVYASATGSVSTQDAAIATVTKPLKLKAGKSVVVTVKYTVPVSLAAGAYHLVAAVAGGSSTAPAIAAAAGTVAVAAATVDLSPAIVAPTTGVKLGPAGSVVSVRLANRGTVTATGSATITVSAVAADGSTVGIVGSTVATRLRVAAGRSVPVRVAVTPPAGVAAGSYTLVATVTDSVTSPADDDPTDNVSPAVPTRE